MSAALVSANLTWITVNEGEAFVWISMLIFNDFRLFVDLNLLVQGVSIWGMDNTIIFEAVVTTLQSYAL